MIGYVNNNKNYLPHPYIYIYIARERERERERDSRCGDTDKYAVMVDEEYNK